MSPIPVLLMVQELGVGGSERQMTEIARALDRSRFAPHVASLRPEGFRAADLQRARVPVARFPVNSFRSRSLWTAASQMGAYLRRHEVRIVHTFDLPTNLFGVPVARAFQTPLVIASQRAFRELAAPGLRHLARLTDRMVDAIVVNCKAVETHLVEDERVPPGLIRLCYNGIDTSVFRRAETPRPEALRSAPLVIGVVCALRAEKGLPLLLEAFARVRRLCPGMRLAVVGSGPVLPQLQTLVRQLELNEDCVFQPTTPHVAEWLRAIDIFVLPSLSEALSNALMEAMACGCCAVASRVGGNGELIADQSTGLLFPSGDAAALASALRLLIGNPDLRLRLAEAGRRSIAAGFSLEASARRMGEIYADLAGAQAPRREKRNAAAS